MTMIQDEIVAHVTNPNAGIYPITPDSGATAAEAAPVPGYKGWCPECYRDGIERLCNGFTIQHQDPSSEPVVVPPLAPGVAVSVRAARDLILIQRADYPRLASQHPQHAGSR